METATQKEAQHSAKPCSVREPLLVRVEEAARLLSLSRSLIYQMFDRGELPSVRCGTARRIPTAALQRWIEEHQA